MADIEHTPLPDVVARLVPGAHWRRPRLLVDTGSPPGDVCWALADCLIQLTSGTGQWMRPVRVLHSVS